VHLLQGSFGGMRTVQATWEVSGVEVRIDCGVMTRVCLGSAKYPLRPDCWRQREVRITLCFLNWNWEQEYALGLGGMKSQTWYWLVSATLLNSTV